VICSTCIARMDDAVVSRLHAVATVRSAARTMPRTGLNNNPAQSHTRSIFGLAEVRSIRALNTWGQHGVMQNENLNDFNRLQVITVGRLEGVHGAAIHLQSAISGLLSSEQ
jgi:hypothetical protein